MIERISDIFFDLDRTLWDFDSNSKETFKELFNKYEMKRKGVEDFDTLYTQYQLINHNLWDLYRQGEIKKDFLNIERFYQSLLLYHIDDRVLAAKIAADYIFISPTKKRLFPNTHEILTYLKESGYKLHIITNGFPEVQHIKLRNSDLKKYFSQIIISEEVGYKKPSHEIFHIAMKMAKANSDNSIMIGDDPLVDIQGAIDVGMDAIFVNHHHEPDCNFCKYQVSSLLGIKKLL